jgi:multiple sugar transport system substrate-binding protein
MARRLPLALLIALLMCGCGRKPDSRTELRFWNGFTGPDGVTMLRLVQRFNRENPDVRVLMQRMDWATYYNKLYVAGIGHRAPEVFVLQTHAVPRFARARFIRTVDDLIGPRGGLLPSQFDPNIWQTDTIDNRQYGIPLDIWVMGMYYNRRLFRSADLIDASGRPVPPANRGRFVDAARRMTDRKAGTWGFAFTNFESNVYSVMLQFGGSLFSPDGTRCTLNSPENVAALQLCVDLIWKERVAAPPENFDSWIGFRQGRVGMVWEGIYMLADLESSSDLEYAGAPTPTLGSRPAVWSGSHNLCLRADLSPRQVQAAWRFIRFLSDNSLDWAAGGQIPARRDLRALPRFKSMTVQAEFARQVPYAVPMPRVPFAFELQSEFDLAVERALRRTVTPQQALDAATRNVDRVMKQ